MFKKRIGKAVSVLVFIILAMALFASPALHAREIISLSTPFTGITSMPGERNVFPIRLENTGAAARNVSLNIVEAPADWPVAIKGRGFEIFKVFVRGDDHATFDLEVQIPEEVEAGLYRFVLEAAADGIKDTIPVEIRVQEGEEAAARLTSDYPVLRGPSGTEFKYRLNLINDSAQAQMFSLMAEAPPGWVVVFHPAFGEEQIASINVEPGATQGLDVAVRSPELLEAREYPITVGAVGSLATASMELKAVITGTYEMDVSTPTGHLSTRARAGEDNLLTLQVVNRGTAELRNIAFSAASPRNWVVRFDPETLERLPAGESAAVKAFIKPDSKAIAGDYALTISGRSAETADSADFRVTVLTPTLWGVIGIGVVLLVIGSIFVVFKVYGRR